MEVKAGARERLEANREQLITLSRRIHAHPELAWEEEKSSTWIAEALDNAGF
jgi:metal-dependent amidase/aminoacylase/carboxypeptidase family protein